MKRVIFAAGVLVTHDQHVLIRNPVIDIWEDKTEELLLTENFDGEAFRDVHFTPSHLDLDKNYYELTGKQQVKVAYIR